MSHAVRKLVGQAVIQLLNGDRESFDRWVQLAMEEYNQQKERERLHATIREILEAKGMYYAAS
jgi:hypothetical protein